MFKGGRSSSQVAPAATAGRRVRRAVRCILLAVLFASSAMAEAPQRVVSMNVCTDQLAMLLAAPGQLISVSHLATDPGSSAMTDEAKRYKLNHGLAEEISLMKPDLVLAGTFTTTETVSMLQRLGFTVERFDSETSFDDVRANILRMGALLGQDQRAQEMAETLDRGLRALQASAVEALTVATYASNSYTSGRGSLAEAVIEAAGLINLGSEAGVIGAGRLPLEVLVLSMPEIITSDTPVYDAPALAQENFVHPAYRAVIERARAATVPSPNWICGGPFNLVAASILQDAARSYGQSQHGGGR
jgi:iron complex transport system substrate-binding protein